MKLTVVKKKHKKNRCVNCSHKIKNTLIASHVIPWKECASREEALSLQNIIFLCPHHHKVHEFKMLKNIN